ncbi:MAG: N-acetylmuramoyl-L-alanine amidase [Planctomycetes bacterium]|nr:N-acetylmuramoyl-L-alanine amidase [Planctomycetota bacterium]
MRSAQRCLVPVVAFLLSLGAVWGQQAPNRPPVNDTVLSPNKTTTGGRAIRYIVIHTAEGSYQGTLSWFKNPASRVSAHYTVAKDGRLGQSVLDKDIAWHAGNANRNSIGIEHEGFARHGGWTEAQYRKSAWISCWLIRQYHIPFDRKHILGHVEVPGATHTDPGPHWDWAKYMQYVDECLKRCQAGTCSGKRIVVVLPSPQPGSGSSSGAHCHEQGGNGHNHDD